MNVLHVVPFIDPLTGSAERIFKLSDYLRLNGIQSKILTSRSIFSNADQNSSELIFISSFGKRYTIPISFNSIFRSVKNADIIHIISLWSALNIPLYIAIRYFNKPYVICPAGSFPIFGRSALLKKIFNFIIGRQIVNNASAVIAITKNEFNTFLSYGVEASKIIIIPNGISPQEFLKSDFSLSEDQNFFINKPIILFMGRLNFIKGPDLLLEAFLFIQDHLPHYHLVFAGKDEGMRSKLIKFANNNDLARKVHFLGHVSGNRKLAAYRMADVLVVPSRQEAMSIVAIEAGACGIPALITNTCGFSEIKSVNPILEVVANANGIAEGLIILLGKKKLRMQIAASFNKFVLDKYTMKEIGLKHLNLFKKILNSQNNSKNSY